MFRKFFAVLIFLLLSSCANAEKFIPEQPVIPVKNIKQNMNGYILTVMQGTQPVKIPVKTVSVVPQKPGTDIGSIILIKFSGKNRLAQGMSGSPLYINGKLAGAVRSGWENSDQSLAMVTPIESMCAVFDDEKNFSHGSKEIFLGNASVSGMNINSLSNLGRTLGINFTQGISAGSNELEIKNSAFKPGDSIAALLVWGDVEISAAGTVTATSKDGRFLAFGHDFLNRGRSFYPSARAFVHDTVNSSNFPFKLVSPLYINGTVIHDRLAGIGGQTGIFAPSFAGEFIFRNLDFNYENKYKFRVVADEFISAKLIEGVFTGLAQEAWGRKGQGTFAVNLRIDGKNIPNGWARSDIFFSEDDVCEAAFKEVIEMINSYLTQPFSETMPSGFTLTVDATSDLKILKIEDVETVSHAGAGDEIEVKVKLRGWRTEPFIKKFTLKIPEDASGVCELVVRGGNEEPMEQISVKEGLKSIDSLERMLAEFKAVDANNEIILELNADRLGNALEKALKKKAGHDDEESDFLPEELEYLSQTKERRIKEGSLKIFSSEYFISGLMKRIIHVEK